MGALRSRPTPREAEPGRERKPRGSSPAASSAVETRSTPQSPQVFICCPNCSVQLLFVWGFLREGAAAAILYRGSHREGVFSLAFWGFVQVLCGGIRSDSLISSIYLLSPLCLVGILIVNKLLVWVFSTFTINIHFLVVERDCWDLLERGLISECLLLMLSLN